MPTDTTKTKATTMTPAKSGSSMVGMYILILVLLIVVAGAGYYLMQRGGQSSTSFGVVKNDTYQAVFLGNGQVYFGKMTKVENDYVKLEDVYYLRVQDQLQGESNTNTAANVTNQPQVLLVRLGNELHKPEKEMVISRSQVLFWENLEKDSPIIKGIDESKKQGDAATTPTNTNTTTKTNTNTK